MDEENSDDELPSITLSQDSSTREVVMPSAREVAAQRERELRTELELRRLREHSPPPVGAGAAGGGAGGGAPRSDSSGSEGEAALAAAVRALRVLPPPRPRPAHARAAGRLLRLLPLPPNTLQQYTAAFDDDASPSALKKAVNHMVLAVSCALSCEANAWHEDDVMVAAGVTSAAALAAPAPRAAPRRALHRALALAEPFPRLVSKLAERMTAAALPEELPASSSERLLASNALLALSDASRGGPPPAERLAALLVRHALTVLLAPHEARQEHTEPLTATELHSLLTDSRGGWRALCPVARRTALRLAARALGGDGDAGGRRRVLAALQSPAGGAGDKQHPDHLQVVVAASTLQLLFRAPPIQ